MSGLPVVPAFRHPASTPDAVDASSPQLGRAGGVTLPDVAVDAVPVDVVPVDVVGAVELGPWGCNAVDGCPNTAVIQWAAPAPTDDDPLATVPVFACVDHEGA